MTPDSSQPTPTSFERPSARAASGLPVQRGNYGIPPRQSTSQAQPVRPGPRSMDIVPPPRPVQSRQIQPPQPPVVPVPSQPAVAAEQNSVTQSPARTPLYTNKPIPKTIPVPTGSTRGRAILPKLRLVLFVVAALLALGGTVRWITAGSTAGNLIAAGAIAANDGDTMTVQFTANDGEMHKFTDKSDPELIPGKGVQVAYRSGAPDNSAKRVEPIQAARSLGVSLFVAGAILLLTAGAVTLLMRRNRKHSRPASIANPVTV